MTNQPDKPDVNKNPDLLYKSREDVKSLANKPTTDGGALPQTLNNAVGVKAREQEPSPAEDAALRAKVIEAICFRPDIVGHLEQFEAVERLIEAEKQAARARAQANAVAWTIGVIDEIHGYAEGYHDRIYKGIKNNIRDRYKSETGIDPAPNYPVKATLKQSRKGVE